MNPPSPSPQSGRWNPRILLRYALLQLPAIGLLAAVLFALRHWFGLTWGWLALIAGVWLIKDIVLYPLVWQAYDPAPRTHGNSLVGHTGVVVRELAPEGMVEIHGELWRARSGGEPARLGEGERVRVLTMEGLLLRVAPTEDHKKGREEMP